MTPTEAVMFVRQVGMLWPQQRLEDGTPDAWYMAGLKDIPLADGAEAITGLAKVKTFISLAEILTEVKRLRAGRLAAQPMLSGPRPELTEDPPAYRAELTAAIGRIADGRSVRRAIARGGNSRPSAEYDQVRGADADPIRRAAKKVPCPWPVCKAPAGSACTNAVGGRLKEPAHEGRLVKAGLADWVEIHGVPRLVMRGEQVAE
ncbi:MAG TPA: hypothetical protein VIS29_13660 [Streptomyces sp.]|jgi:hypothetical protein